MYLGGPHLGRQWSMYYAKLDTPLLVYYSDSENISYNNFLRFYQSGYGYKQGLKMYSFILMTKIF